MEWLNYHHLRYFWTVAKEGTLARAALKLNVSQSSISEQMRELEESLGESLFRREGRSKKLTDAGQIVFGYADEIFSLGREMLNTVKQRPGSALLILSVGVVDSFPKLVTNDILAPVFALKQPVRVICREGKLGDLLPQLAAHRLDLVLSDEAPSSSTNFKTYSRPLRQSGVSFCAEKRLAARLKMGFPNSLHDAPALLPAENTAFRRALDVWFQNKGIQPRVVAECDDLALMKTMAADGRGFTSLPGIALESAMKTYAFRAIGHAEECRLSFNAITAERRILHPGVSAIVALASPTSADAPPRQQTRTHRAAWI